MAGPMLLTVEDVARRLQLSRAQTYKLIMSGEIASLKLGANRRIAAEALREYVDGLIAEGVGESE